ncbi:unnamed protein product [Candidula unifasciata]|uniref:WD repeat-containing protein 54 beta-propeller domain-containing protein n=1 Tax=Candidula unifasciata TaxID=100452 RepID=A0A8S3ZZL5_9EUPU|nr:unnamed protein product [Candidula unifasciata]
MYRQDVPITMKGTASSLCNNLSVHAVPDKRQINYAVVHKSLVNLISATTDGSSVVGRQILCKEPAATQGVPFVMQVKWVILPTRSLLVLTTGRGIQIFEPDGAAMVYFHSLSDSLDKSNYAKGVAGVGEKTLCVGTETGAILMFDVPAKGNNITLLDTVCKHQAPVSDLTSEKDVLASADDLGTIIMWTFNGIKLSPVTSIRGTGWPCNSLALWKSVVIAGFASGHLRVYNANSGICGAEVLAHARTINAVDVSRDNGMVLSVSDDTFFRVWHLKALNVPQIEFCHGETVKNSQLVGGRFVDGQGRALCVTGYDSSEITFFVRV